MNKKLKYYRGLYRLWWNLCPNCNSSPPKTDCFICNGSYEYGRVASGLGGPLNKKDKEIWRYKWRMHRR